MVYRKDFIIIGGGIVGSSIAYDLHLRGYDVLLLEKNSIIPSEASLNNQWNYLSGMRYIVSDFELAKLCCEENKIYRKIAKDFILAENNYFISFNDEYEKEALKNAKRMTMNFEKIDEWTIKKELSNIYYNDKINVIKTADMVINVRTYIQTLLKDIDFCLFSKVTSLIKKGANVIGVKSRRARYYSDFVINAAGSGVNEILRMINEKPLARLSRGYMFLLNSDMNYSLQLLRYPSDGDAFILSDGFGSFGTAPNYIKLMEEYSNWSNLVDLSGTIIRKDVYGFRTLVDFNSSDRKTSRKYRFIDHKNNLFTVYGGKLTLARKMAEDLIDYIVSKYDNNRRCLTKEKEVKICE